jgi:abhydrolase domain-containing protein 6
MFIRKRGGSMKKLICIVFSLLPLILLGGCNSLQEPVYDVGISAERLLSGMDEAYVTVQGQRTAYLERQGSGDTIVLLHGFGADKDNWVRFTRFLPKEYRVIAFDLPGHGDNVRENDKACTIDFITQGFADAADGLKLDRFHIVGNSMGGWVGIRYTILNPERVITLGLFDTAGIKSPEPSDLQKAIEKGRNILIPTSEDAFQELMGYAFYKQPFIPWPAPHVLARKSLADAPFKQKMWNDIHSTYKDVAGVLPDLRLPVLVLWGARDRITHVSSVQVLERYLPNSKTVIMPDCGHMPMLERPQEAALDYVAFLKEHHVKEPSPE